MKKFLSIVSVLCIMLAVCAMPVMAEDVIMVTVDGKKVDCAAYGQEPVIVEGRTLVPLRSVFEALGAQVEWDNPTRTVIAQMDDIKIALTVDSDQMLVNNAVKTIDVPACIMNERTMVPVRAVAEAFGCIVKWDNDARCVVITSLQAEISAPLTSTQMMESAESTVMQMWSKIKSGDMEAAAEYYADNENAGEKFSMDAIVAQMTGNIDKTMFTHEQLESMEKKAEELLVQVLAHIEMRIDSSAVINSETVQVNVMLQMPDFNTFDFQQLENSEAVENLLIQILDKYGYTLETMEAMTEVGPGEIFVTLSGDKWLITE